MRKSPANKRKGVSPEGTSICSRLAMAARFPSNLKPFSIPSRTEKFPCPVSAASGSAPSAVFRLMSASKVPVTLLSAPCCAAAANLATSTPCTVTVSVLGKLSFSRSVLNEPSTRPP